MEKILNNKTKERYVFSDKAITDQQFKNLCEVLFLKKNSMSKKTKKIKSILTEEERTKIEKKAEQNNFYYLNSFLMLYKEKIVISQSTFYLRFLSNKNIIQYLINKGYIYAYKSKEHIYKDLNKSEKIHFIINYKLAKEFAQIIYNNFLTEKEKDVDVVPKKRKYTKNKLK